VSGSAMNHQVKLAERVGVDPPRTHNPNFRTKNRPNHEPNMNTNGEPSTGKCER